MRCSIKSKTYERLPCRILHGGIHRSISSLTVGDMRPRNLLKVKTPWPKPQYDINARMIPAKLEELAREGKYYDSKVLDTIKYQIRSLIP